MIELLGAYAAGLVYDLLRAIVIIGAVAGGFSLLALLAEAVEWAADRIDRKMDEFIDDAR